MELFSLCWVPVVPGATQLDDLHVPPPQSNSLGKILINHRIPKEAQSSAHLL